MQGIAFLYVPSVIVGWGVCCTISLSLEVPWLSLYLLATVCRKGFRYTSLSKLRKRSHARWSHKIELNLDWMRRQTTQSKGNTKVAQPENHAVVKSSQHLLLRFSHISRSNGCSWYMQIGSSMNLPWDPCLRSSPDDVLDPREICRKEIFQCWMQLNKQPNSILYSTRLWLQHSFQIYHKFLYEMNL